MTSTNKILGILIIVYFVILYMIALFSNKGYEQPDDVLFVSRRQWEAIFIMWIPSLIAVLMR